MTTVYQAFLNSLEKYPEHTFLNIPSAATRGYQNTAVNLSYSAIADWIDQLSQNYKAHGYGLGLRVALLLENRADFFAHWLALNKLGVSVVPVNGEMQIDEIAYLLDNSDACLVISIPEKQAKLEQATAQLSRQIPIIATDDFASLPDSPLSPTEATPNEQSECAILYTSGSTGKPKGCMLSNEYFLECGRWYVNLDGLCKQEPGKERIITPLPLVHMNAMACSSMAMLMSGGCIVQLDRFHPKSWWASVRESKATIIHYLGVMPAILLNMPPSPDEDFSQQIKFGFGAGVNPEHHAPFEQRFGFPLIEAWAMTESGTAGCIIANHEPRSVGTSCLGKRSDQVAIKLVDDEGVEVSQGQPGELLVRAAGDNPRKGFFSGYYKNDAATQEAWEGNWLHTGDILRQDQEGYFYFVDRKKNVIRRSGENISALEVEAALVLDSRVDQVAVTPVPDEIRGDEVMACIILKTGAEASQATATSIFERAMQSLVYYKLPGYIAFVEQLPLTASQKLQRGEVKLLGRELLSKGNCFDLRNLKRRPR